MIGDTRLVGGFARGSVLSGREEARPGSGTVMRIRRPKDRNALVIPRRIQSVDSTDANRFMTAITAIAALLLSVDMQHACGFAVVLLSG